MTKYVNIYVGDEIVAVNKLFREDGQPWTRLVQNDFIIINVTDLPRLPSLSDKWDGEKFTTLSGLLPSDHDPNFVWFTFVIGEECVLTEPLHRVYQLPLIAAYSTGIRLELIDERANPLGAV